MSHKRSNERLRGERLAGDLWAALDSASWQAEEARRQAWAAASRSRSASDSDDFDIEKVIEDGMRD
ncbi:MAG TPA: hypothetical protein VGJ28_19340 [Micromonosporaceae bacterium]|jgi:hypothetical protein